jgi:hypothetical protein
MDSSANNQNLSINQGDVSFGNNQINPFDRPTSQNTTGDFTPPVVPPSPNPTVDQPPTFTPPTINNENVLLNSDQNPAIQTITTPSKKNYSLPNQNNNSLAVHHKLINFLLLILGPLFMVGAFAFTLFSYKNQPKSDLLITNQPKTLEMLTSETGKEALYETLINVPKNPKNVTVTCQSTKIELASEIPNNCPDPIFAWSGEETQEEGTKIIGYYVYFGTNNNDQPLGLQTPMSDFLKVIRPRHDGVFQTENFYSPTNLSKGTTYYFAVSAVSDSQNPAWKVGLDLVDLNTLTARSAKILFVYNYQ